MEEIWKSVAEAIKLRATTALVGSYFLFWAATHWQVIYTTIFVSEKEIVKKFGMLKNEYINTYFLQPRWDDVWFYISLLIPFVLVYLWIWILPKMLFIKSFHVERDYKLSKRQRILSDQTALKRLEKSLADESKDVARAELEKAKDQLEATQKELEAAKNSLRVKELIEKDQKDTDSDEYMAQKYQDFMYRGDAEKILEDVSNCVYGHFGNIIETDQYDHVRYRLDSNSLAIADTHRLVEITSDNRKIALTDLGKYFLSKR
jgi:hypothetical protein